MRYSTLISASDLAAHLDVADWVVCDCRHDLAAPEAGRRAYAEAHIPAARFVHLDEDLSAPRNGKNGRHPLPEVGAFARRLGELGIDNAKQAVAYDASGGYYAARLWWMLRWLGHEAAAVLDGGFAKWTREGRAVSAEPTVPNATKFAVTHVAPTVNSVGVESSLSRHTLLLVDARAPERFRGEVEPMDPVAGHIPGAVNRPASLNVTPEGVLKPAATLRAEYKALLGGRPHTDVVHHCGSGVTACHNILAMEIAGMPGTRLYPGSWSEWIANPARPIGKAVR